MDNRDEGETFHYLTQTFSREPEGLAVVRHMGNERRAGLQISPYEGALLAWLVQISGAKKILEIGTFVGYSALWMASTGAEVTTVEFSAENAALAQTMIDQTPYHDRVTVCHSDALKWMEDHSQEPTYDLVFIDAEKKSYLKYLEACLPLLKPKGWIIGDNTLLWGAVAGNPVRKASQEAIEAMQAFNARLANPEEFEGMMIPTPEGLTIARRRS